jgi:glucose-1-phosphate adenylyltransferase
MKKVLAMILAGGQGTRLSILADERAKPAMPFAGKYRIIDFTLSNCINSGISNVAVLTQYWPISLNRHIGNGESWDLNRKSGGIQLRQPFMGREVGEWYSGTADAIYKNLGLIVDGNYTHVMILAGDHVYAMDYRHMIDLHELWDADVTISGITVSPADATRFGIMETDENGWVKGFEEKPEHPKGNLASMGIYFFEKSVLLEALMEDAEDSNSSHDFGKDIIPKLIHRKKVFSTRFNDYWRDLGTIESYWQTNMDLLADLPEFNLYNAAWVIHTRSEEMPPVKFGPNARVSRSMISNGCIINGVVEHSVLSPGVYVSEGTVIRDSIIMNNTRIGRGTVIERSILDKQITVGDNCRIGYGDDFTVSRLYPEYLNSGITVIGKGAEIPAGMTIGRNCKIDPWVPATMFTDPFVPSGESIEKPAQLHPRHAYL